MNLPEIIGDRILVKPSEAVIQEAQILIPSMSNFWYLLDYGDYINGSGLMGFQGAYDQYRMNSSVKLDTNAFKAKTVREYWKYLSRKTSAEAIDSVSPELKLRIDLVDAVITRWNTKLASVLSWQEDTYDQLKASQEYKNIACIAWDGQLPYLAQDALPHVIDMKSFFYERRHVLYSWSIALDRISEFTNQGNQDLLNMFERIPDWSLDLWINVDHPETGKQYRLYPKVDNATLAHFLSNFENPLS